MPKSKMDWSKNVVYKICCKDLNITDIYVGHTTDLVKRRCQHKADCNKENRKNYNLKVYQFIRVNGGWDNWEIILVDKCPCLDFEEAAKIERYYFETLNATLNMVIPSRTRKEYREDNKDIIAENRKNNRELLNKYAREKVKCECGCIVSNCHLARHKNSQKHMNSIHSIIIKIV